MALTPAKLKRKGLSSRLLLIIVIVASMAFLTIYSVEGEGGVLHGARSVVATIASPIQRVASVIAIPFQAIGNGITNASASSEDLTTLQQENAELTAQLAELTELQLENQRLTELLSLSQSYDLETTAARVISVSSDSWNRTITIDKGSVDGIESGMPVMSSEGLIGQVETVALNSSVVRLITDENSGVAVLLQNSRAEGVLSGSSDGLLRLEFVSSSVEVTLGEAVVTTGLGGVYPSGLVVGYVTRIETNSSDTYHTIIVQPLASSAINTEVLILTGGETEAVSTAEVVSSEDSSSEDTTDDDSDSS